RIRRTTRSRPGRRPRSASNLRSSRRATGVETIMLDWWLPENVSTYGRDIDWLFHVIYWITGVTFILVAVTLIAFLVLYRDRPGRKARYTHGSTPLEIAWTVVPAFILVVLTFLSVPAWSKIKMQLPPTDFTLQ